ncbi:Uncharacterised protein [Mycobacteroides abscessus subsp. abscessus]|nr:Uncharacterised protein [Mycobacteroides abscessus subsp. abscessus]
MFTIAPPPLALRIGANARAIRNGPKTLVWNVVSMRSKSPVSSGSGCNTPALLTTISTSVRSRARASTDSAEVTSSCLVTTCARGSSNGARAVLYTLRAPRPSTSSTMAAPNPRRPPVTSTTLSSTMLSPN